MALESIQFVVFLPQGVTSLVAHQAGKFLFADRFPNSFNEVGPGQTVATYLDAEHQIMIGSAPGRYDVIITRTSPPTQMGAARIIMNVLQDEYLPLMCEFAHTLRPSRLAIVARSNSRVRSKNDSLQAVKKMLPKFSFPEGTSEIDHKINVPKISNASPGLTLNRLHRWFNLATIDMMLGPNGVVPGKAEWNAGEEIDINTDSLVNIETSLSREILKELFSEVMLLQGRGPEAFEVIESEN